MKQDNTSSKPRIEEVSVVANNIILLTVQQGKVEGGVQVPYEPLPGETLEEERDIPALVYIMKDGERIGVKVEDTQEGTKRFPYEQVVGLALDTAAADDPDSYSVNGAHPIKVYRKTKPNDIADPDRGYTYSHLIYLVCDKRFDTETDIDIDLAEGIFDKGHMAVHFDLKLLSEAIHVNQLGYRPDDPSKKAYLSQWMGLGGGISYDDYKGFYLLDEEGSIVFEGNTRLNHTGEIVPVGNEEISSLCPIYEMDFTEFKQTGMYQVAVPGLGCSVPFAIGESDTWEKGFRASMNAMYCQRSGIVTGPPYSEFKRPRCYHPDDGKVVYQSRCSLFESGNGLNSYGTDTNNFGNLVRKATDEVVQDAWGGYFDACDWDRRVQHLNASKLHIELYLMCPDYFNNCKLSIPESGNGIPDILNEALYNIDFYKRLQLPDGGVRGGIEQEEHPILGQCGWQDTWKAYAYAPDFWSSYYYAAAAARMAYALKGIKPEKAMEYRKSAEAAFSYAERTYKEGLEREGHKWTREAHTETIRQRENAACDLFRLTMDPDYERVYLEIRDDRNFEADFVYCMLPNGIGDEPVKRKCREAIIAAADTAVANGSALPYHLTSDDLATEEAGGYCSFCTIPRNAELIRAHFLTGDSRYLEAAIAAEDFTMGANGDNLCYTTGVGARSPKHILHHDSRMTGQEPPVGITVFGPHDFHHYPDDSFARLIRADFMWPGAYAWPSFESYLDIYRYPCVTEYTVQSSIGPNAYRWGYFAARGKLL